MTKVTSFPDSETRGTGHLAPFRLSPIVLFLLFLNCTVNAQVYPDAEVDRILNKGIRCLVNQDFFSSEKYFKALDKEYPALPLGKIYLAAAIITRSYDLALPYDEDKIEYLLNSAIEQSEKLIEQDKENVWNIYFLALAQGYLAYFKALNDSWLPAFTGGLGSVSEFEKCLDKDKSFYEAYAALGAYKYWRSRKTEFLNWLPFIDDEKKEGIKYLETAIKKSHYNYYLAVYSLQWIYIDLGDYAKAKNISERALKDYPGSRFFKWGYARALEDIDMNKAVSVYYDILNSYPPETNHYNEIVLKHIIAQCCRKMGENEKALNLCNHILSVSGLADYVKEKLGDRLERVKKLRAELISSK
jgi:tetratricopeptide (TPR) repeat protein